MNEAEAPQAGFLRLLGLRKTFGPTVAVADLDLTVREGEFVSLLGPSGCGKTTTLRMIAGFMAPTRGEIWLGDRRIDAVPSHRRDAAMVFQNYALFPHMTVAENVAFGLKMQKRPKTEIAARVGEVLDLVQLGHLGERYPRELSGGQQQRVALARAVVLKPKLLLLDEPLSNLDAKLRKELRAEFVKIHRVSGATTVFVTHDIEEAFAVSDRVAVMNAGVVEQYDTPANIFGHPRTPFVAEFVGHSNHISGTIEAGEGGPVLRAHGIPFRPGTGFAPGDRAHLAIPAHLVTVAAAPVPADNCVPVTVESASYLGTSVRYQLVAEDGLSLLAEMPVHRGQQIFAEGDRAFCCWSADDFINIPAEAA